MNKTSRFPAVLNYLLPIIGWLYVYFFERKNSLALYHLRQSLGLFLFLVAALVSWAVVGWVLAWIPYLSVLAIALFAIVIVAYLCGFAAWVIGLSNAFKAVQAPLPLFGEWAERLPFR